MAYNCHYCGSSSVDPRHDHSIHECRTKLYHKWLMLSGSGQRLKALQEVCNNVADLLEQRGINKGDNRFPATFRFGPEVREFGSRLRAAIQISKTGILQDESKKEQSTGEIKTVL